MWILKAINTKRDDEIRVYTDSQALIKAIRFPKAKSGQTLLTEFTALAKQIPGRIKLSWISGHTDVPGNEAADAAAKDAARGTSSEKASLPPLLRKRVLTSASAEKQAYHEELKGQWASRWEDSPRKPRFDKIDPNFPFNKFRKVGDQLNRAQSSMLVQVRTGHIPLNVRLHRMNKLGTDKCPNCQDTRGEERARETVEHYLFECRAYQVERRELLTTLTTDHPDIAELTNDLSHAKALLKYIARTGRFKNFKDDILLRNLNSED